MPVRVILTLAFIAAGIAIMYWLQPLFGGLTAVLVGSLFFIFSLSIWTLPPATFQRGLAQDPAQRRIVGTFLGIGMGMIGGLAVAALIPPPLNWIIIGAVLIAAIVWYRRK